VPLVPLLAVIVAVVIAAVVLWAVNQPESLTVTTTGGEAISAPLAAPAAVPAPESPVFRHSLVRMRLTGAGLQTYRYARMHQIEGTSLDPRSSTPYGTTSYQKFDNQR
jgi:hypothetical protein